MLKARPKSSIITNENGNAMIETIPLIVIFLMLTSYALGLYGVVHTATLASIGARAHGFALINNRANYTWYNDRSMNPQHYADHGFRYHSISVSDATDEEFHPLVRPIYAGRVPASDDNLNINRNNADVHQNSIYELNVRNRTIGVSPVWVMVGYGICLNPACGAPAP